MAKRAIIVLASSAALLTFGFLALWFMFYYEPIPNQRDVEAMVRERDLMEFGEVEGSFLLTPRNYGFYDENNIYIVEQYLDKGGDYGNQYVVIEKGIPLSKTDEHAIGQLVAKEEFSNEYVKDFEVLSKHRVNVYKNGEKTAEHWFFKVIHTYDGDSFLTFALPESADGDRFNLFTDGYERFLEF